MTVYWLNFGDVELNGNDILPGISKHSIYMQVFFFRIPKPFDKI